MGILVTGANGFLGSAVVKQAQVAGISVRGTDRSKGSPTSTIDYVRADIREKRLPIELFAGVDTVIHAAGLAHGFHNIHPKEYAEVNERGTANLAAAAARGGVRHFVLISSVSVYGGNSPESHEDAPCKPNDPYSESKYQSELRSAEIAQSSGVDLTILRPVTLYGENDPGNVGRLMRCIDQRRFIWIGTGLNRKSLLHRDDAARACIAAVQRMPAHRISVYNVSAPSCSMQEVVDGLAQALRRRILPVRIPATSVQKLIDAGARLAPTRMSDLRRSLAKWLSDDVYDGGKFEKEFNFKTLVTLEEGLKREVAWYRAISG